MSLLIQIGGEDSKAPLTAGADIRETATVSHTDKTLQRKKLLIWDQLEGQNGCLDGPDSGLTAAIKTVLTRGSSSFGWVLFWSVWICSLNNLNIIKKNVLSLFIFIFFAKCVILIGDNRLQQLWLLVGMTQEKKNHEMKKILCLFKF